MIGLLLSLMLARKLLKLILFSEATGLVVSSSTNCSGPRRRSVEEVLEVPLPNMELRLDSLAVLSITLRRDSVGALRSLEEPIRRRVRFKESWMVLADSRRINPASKSSSKLGYFSLVHVR